MSEDRTLDRELEEKDEAYFDGATGPQERSFDTHLLREPASVLPVRKPLVLSRFHSVTDSIRAMQSEHRGVVVVTEDGTMNGRVVGIFTERDVLFRIVDQGRNPATLPLADVMTADPECLRDDHPERGPARDPEDRGLGQWVAGEGLKPRTRHRERAAREQSGQDARQPQAQHHHLVHTLDAAGEHRQHLAGRYPRAAEEKRPERDQCHHETQPGQQHREPSAGRGGRPHHRTPAFSKASGWINRASTSRPSTMRGP